MLFEILLFAALVISVLLIIPQTRNAIFAVLNDLLDRTLRKKASEEKVLELLRSRPSLKDGEIKDLLGTSEKTVSLYMKDLLVQGRVVRTEITKRGTGYRLGE